MFLIYHNLLFTFYFFSSPNDGSFIYIYIYIHFLYITDIRLNIFLLMAGGKQEQYEAKMVVSHVQ